LAPKASARRTRNQVVAMPDEHKSDPQSLLPLKPMVFHILLLLTEQERHGYDIVKQLEGRFADGRRILPGNLYRTLRSMLADGLIEESEERPDTELDDERRRYFRLTGFGLEVARREAARLQSMVVEARAHDLLKAR
jgi:DNA-binding PadR family transcriptional regulator